MNFSEIEILLVFLLYIAICDAYESLDQRINYDFELFKTKFKKDFNTDDSNSTNEAERF